METRYSVATWCVILALVARCVWAFALALTIAGAPLAATVCVFVCESHGAGVIGPHSQHHSCAGPADPTMGPAIEAVAHSCDHPSDGVGALAVQQATQLVNAPALVPTQAISQPEVCEPVPSAHALAIEKSPPGLLALIAQLRV